MRRAMLAAFGVTALALTAPGAALAHHHGRHHHKIRSKARHARVRFEHFGASASATAGAGTPTTAPTTPTTAPTTPTSTNEDAGTVVSYEKEVLTIKLKDESTVTGKVTSNTHIECMSTTSTASPTEQAPGDDKGAGDDENSQGDDDQQSSSDDDQSSDDQSDSSDDDADVTVAATPEPPCDSSALKPGTVVHAAELRISSTGAEFESIELVR